MGKRVFLIVLDSVGIGEAPDAAEFGDLGSNTLKACYDSGKLFIPNLERLGIFSIDGVGYAKTNQKVLGSYGRLMEQSRGKDTTIGHWELAGLISEEPLPVYPDGFPKDVLEEFTRRTGREVICNRPYSGTDVIRDYGRDHVETGRLIVYTSADSVFQIAAHEEVVSIEELYRYCEIAREILQGEHGVGRVIARPFVGAYPEFARTSNRHDFSLVPPKDTMCDLLCEAGYDVIGVGKIYDIFAGKSIQEAVRTKSNADGMVKTTQLQERDFNGLVFVNLVDFDSVYGHRNDVPGYTNALNEFDIALGEFVGNMREGDLLLITADHGCDPAAPGTDHSREYVPMLAYGAMVGVDINIGTRGTFADISATVLEFLGVKNTICGKSFLELLN